MTSSSEPEPTKEFHNVDGVQYLCHADDHYCPAPTEQQKEKARNVVARHVTDIDEEHDVLCALGIF